MIIYKLILLLSLPFCLIPSYCQKTAPPALPADSIIKIKEKPAEVLRIDAEFPGSFTGWRGYVEQNLNANVPVINGAPVGLYTVYVDFIVDRDGTVSDIKALTKLGFGMEEELIRLIKKSGNWSPAIEGEKMVKSRKSQYIKFLVTADDYDIFSSERYVLFAGIDNLITVAVRNVKKAHIKLSVSEGTCTPSDEGRYIVRVDKPGRITIDIYNAKKKKPVGNVSFEVRDRNK